MAKKECYIDCKTSGWDCMRHEVVHLSAVFVIGDKITKIINGYINYDVTELKTEHSALKFFNLDLENLKGKEGDVLYSEIYEYMSSVIDKEDPSDKFNILSYNTKHHAPFFLKFFKKHHVKGEIQHTGLFYSNPIDIMHIAGYCLLGQRNKLPNMRLETIADVFEVDVSKYPRELADVLRMYNIIKKIS